MTSGHWLKTFKTEDVVFSTPLNLNIVSLTITPTFSSAKDRKIMPMTRNGLRTRKNALDMPSSNGKLQTRPLVRDDVTK
jgi:hypothetical protein